MKNQKMTKEQAKNYLKESKKIIITLEDWGYSRAYGSSFPYFNVYFLMDSGEITKFFPGEDQEVLNYWKSKKGAFCLDVWGSDRVRECIGAIIRWSGFEGDNEKVHNKAVLL